MSGNFQPLELKQYLHYTIKNNYIEKIEPSFFSDHKDIEKVYFVIRNYYLGYGSIPSVEIIKVQLNILNYEISNASLKTILDDSSYQDNDWWRNQYMNWLKWNISNKEIGEQRELFREGKYEPKTNIIEFLNNTSLFNVFCTGITYNEKKYLIYPILKEGQLGIVFGPTGEGKSIFAMDIANMIAKGQSDWNIFRVDTPPQKVLYIDFELGPESIQSRYRSNKFHPNLIIDCVINYEFNKKVGFDGKLSQRLNTSIKLILDRVKEHNCKVVFIDNLSNIADQTEKASDADMFISNLYGQMKKLGLTIFFIGHTPKLPKNTPLTINQLKGSSSLTKTFESVVGFKLSKDKNISYIKQLKFRDLENVFDDESVAKFEFEDSSNVGWRLNYLGVDIEENLIPDLRKDNGRPVIHDNDKKVKVLYDLLDNKMKQKDLLVKYGIGHSVLFRFKRDLEIDKNHIVQDLNKYREEQKLLDEPSFFSK